MRRHFYTLSSFPFSRPKSLISISVATPNMERLTIRGNERMAGRPGETPFTQLSSLGSRINIFLLPAFSFFRYQFDDDDFTFVSRVWMLPTRRLYVYILYTRVVTLGFFYNPASRQIGLGYKSRVTRRRVHCNFYIPLAFDVL